MRYMLQLWKPDQGMLIFLISVFLLGCKIREEYYTSINPAFTEKIIAFTSGKVTAESTIKIVLAEDITDSIIPNREIREKLLSFIPAIKGKTFWIDKRTIEFRPEEKLKSGQNYSVKFALSKIIPVPKELSVFRFGFKVVKQTLSIVTESYQSHNENDLVWNKVKGSVYTSDYIDNEIINKSIKSIQGNKLLQVKWDASEDRRTFHFWIDSVMRKEKPEKVEINWDLSSIDPDLKGKLDIDIPSINEFKVQNILVVQEPEQYIQIVFSDPIKKNQNFDGLITTENNISFNYLVYGNVLKVYPDIKQTGDSKISVHKGLVNINGKELEETYMTDITFEISKPALKLVGKGIILPSSKGLIFPFEAINLTAVDVRIIKIFETNIGYFLQVNRLDGNYELKRAGRLVHKETVTLNYSPVDLRRWNVFYLDLAKLIQPDPGAIYRIEISFQKEYSLYDCAEKNVRDQDNQPTESNEPEEEISYWDTYEGYYDDYYNYGYNNNWDEYDNPCSPSYYHQGHWIARNILASDLGLIAKACSDNSVFCAVTDLITSKPIADVELTLYNFQQQPLASSITDKDGFANIKTKEKSFLLIARYKKQRGYLRLDDGSSLLLAPFDVAGKEVQRGLKGFIYGERGVWRPGDTLFLNFILEDKQKILPESHPVIFELYNPRGQLYARTTKTSGKNGFYSWFIATDKDAPTGNWNLHVKVGGTQFNKNLKIETVKPNRLKIEFRFDSEKLSAANPKINGNISVHWLHGAVARNLRTSVSVTLTKAPTLFEKYKNFQFTDPAKTFISEEQVIYEGYTDEYGKAVIPGQIRINKNAPGMLDAHIVARVFEKSGEFSVDRFVIPYSPYRIYVGLKTPEGDENNILLTDTTHWVDVVTLNEDGQPVSRQGIEANIYKLNWHSWWEAEYDELADYIGNTYNQPVVNKKITTVNGKGKFSFKIDRPEWGRFYVRVFDPLSGHSAGRIIYVDWPGWAGRSMRENPETASILNFNSDKSVYNAGEVAEIIIPSGGNGRALISIESGSGILQKQWLNITEKETRYKLEITPEMAPNVYVHVSLIQPHAVSGNDMPMRLYGVIPLLVEDPQTHLEPVIKTPDSVEPEHKMSIQVSELNKKEMTYTLAVVEEGLLDLTRFKTPDPWNEFYAREALGVKTWDLYDLVIGAYGGKLGNIMGIGGDNEEETESSDIKVNRFEPVVRFIGPFNLEKGSTNKHIIHIPNYVGSLKAMVVAGKSGAYGFGEKTIPVKKPLMVLVTLPRVLGPGESVNLPVTIFALDKQIRETEIQVKTNDLISCEDNRRQSLVFNKPGEKIINFNLKIASKPGVGKVMVVAKSGAIISESDLELEIRSPNPSVTSFIAGSIEEGKSWETNFNLPGMEGTNSAFIEVSSIPPIDASRRFRYLIEYPHGCVEQVTSAAFAQLYLPAIMELNERTKSTIDKNLKAGINKLRTFQATDGGFSYWPGAQQADSWGNSYAGHFMLEAEKKGYALPVGMKQAWLKSQKLLARQWIPVAIKDDYRQFDLEQAYRLFTLALAGEPEMSAMNRLREIKTLSLQAKWRLAAAYVLTGHPQVAKDLITREDADIQKYTGVYSSYGSRERDWAMILETLLLLDDQTRGAILARKISDVLSSDYWMSTQTTAFCLLAMSKFTLGKTTDKISFNYAFNGTKFINATTSKAITTIELPVNTKVKKGYIKINNTGKGMLFTRLVMNGIPESGTEAEFSNFIDLEIDYLGMDGKQVNSSRLEQGTDFIVNVTVSNHGDLDYKNLVLTQIFPPGWEIHNTRMSDLEVSGNSSIPTYQDIRDDRIYTYFDLNRGEQKTFTIQINAAYLGKFYLSGTYCEAMYDNNISCLKRGKWVEVVKSGDD
jgi:uncharacterized protein YfaS (alpha-2-macroglobulin family)